MLQLTLIAPKTIKESILEVLNYNYHVWLTYEQIETLTRNYVTSSHETIGRRIRELVNEGKILTKQREVKFQDGIKRFSVFKVV